MIIINNTWKASKRNVAERMATAKERRQDNRDSSKESGCASKIDEIQEQNLVRSWMSGKKLLSRSRAEGKLCNRC
jgi:hypothetical protein